MMYIIDTTPVPRCNGYSKPFLTAKPGVVLCFFAHHLSVRFFFIEFAEKTGVIMGENRKPKSNTEIIVALLGCFGLIVAAIIGLGLPFADRLADRVFATPAPGTVVGGEATEQSKEALNCSFHKEIEQKAIIQQWFTVPAGSNNRIGAKVRTTDEVVVPQGWIVQRGNANEYGPVIVHNGETVSIYSPESCRPLK